MKMPKYLIRVGAVEYVIADDAGVATMQKLLRDAVPVRSDLRATPPEITLEYCDDSSMTEYLLEVRCRRIPAHVLWKRKTAKGEVEVVQPVEKKPKALKPPPRKALPAPQRRALPPPSPQLALL